MIMVGLYIVLAVAADQWCKKIVAARLSEGQFSAITSYVSIRRVTHFANNPVSLLTPLVLVILWALAILTSVVMIQSQQFFANPVAQAGLGLALGGAASNLFDRLVRRAILDFIDLGFWPVFNLADIAITVGIPLALVWMR